MLPGQVNTSRFKQMNESTTPCQDVNAKPSRLGPRQEAPFCWQAKAALRRIRAAFDRSGTVSSALLTYGALTEFSSDFVSETFSVTHADIVAKCGLSLRTVQQRLVELQEIGLIEITTPDYRAPSTFRLLSIRE